MSAPDDRKVHNDPNIAMTLVNTGPELITTSGVPAVATKDSYGNGMIQKQGICPKSGKLVESKAGLFDGSNDYISTPVTTAGMTAISVAAWVRADALGVNYAMIASTVGTGVGFEMGAAGTSDLVEFKLKAGSWVSATVTGNASLQLGVWTHFCGTYGDGKIKIYVNGVLANETAAVRDISTGTAQINIGARPSFNWDGAIADVQIYNDELTASEVLWAAGKGGTDPTARS